MHGGSDCPVGPGGGGSEHSEGTLGFLVPPARVSNARCYLLRPGGAAVPELPLHPHLCDSQHPPTTNFVAETELQAGWLTSTTSS